MGARRQARTKTSEHDDGSIAAQTGSKGGFAYSTIKTLAA
jgi:hypothetical protein